MAHLLAAGLGFVAYLSLGPGYISGGVAMVATIVLMILLDLVHPPAVSTALSFAFRAGDERSLVLFAMAVGMISVLVVLEQVMLWLLSRRTRRLSQGRQTRWVRKTHGQLTRRELPDQEGW